MAKIRKGRLASLRKKAFNPEAPMMRCLIRGKSMAPVYRPGQLVQLRQLPPGETPVVGRDHYVGLIEGGGAFGRLISVDRWRIVLGSLNREAPPMLSFFARNRVLMVARATGLIRPFRERKSGSSTNPVHPKPASHRVSKGASPMAA
jgi:hypothetical protein